MSVPPDIMALLQQGGGEAAPAGGDIPPDIMSLLGGMPEGSPEGEPAGALHGGSASSGDPEEFYREALDSLEAGMKADVDEARINTMMQCAAKIQGELANSQKGQDAMMGGKMEPSTMRRMGAADEAY
jgi:hypothetical protein